MPRVWMLLVTACGASPAPPSTVGNAGHAGERGAFSVGPLDGAPDVAPGTECRAPGRAWIEAESALHDAIDKALTGRTVVYQTVNEDSFALWADHAGAFSIPVPAGTIKATLKVGLASGYLFIADGDKARVYCIDVARRGAIVQLIPRLAASADGS